MYVERRGWRPIRSTNSVQLNSTKIYNIYKYIHRPIRSTKLNIQNNILAKKMADCVTENSEQKALNDRYFKRTNANTQFSDE